MFEILVIVFIASLYTAMVLNLLLWGVRLRFTIKEKIPFKKALLIVCMPGSIGYLYHVDAVPKWYRLTLGIIFGLTLIGAIYLAFLNIPAFAHWFFYSL